MMVKSTTAVLATTLLASSAMAWESTTTKPVDPATTTVDEPWLDWTSTTTTTKPVDPVKPTTTSVDPNWLDWTSSTTSTKPVDPAKTTSSTYVWGDWTSTTTTTKKPVDPAKTTSTGHVWDDWTSTTTTTKKPVDPTATSYTWGDWESTAVDPAVCKAVTVTYTGIGIWVPDPAATAWADWDTTTSTTKPVAPTKSSSTSYAADPTWSDWVSSSTTLKTVTTTAAPTTWGPPPSSTTKAATTTTKAPSAAPTCPSDNQKSVLAGGSCGCSFTVNCGVKASPDAKSSFWEKTSGGIVPTLAECLALCDSNDKCEAALWVDDPTNGDYHHCWQISGLGQPTGSGSAQISYKGTCSGKCSESYSKQ